MTLNTYHLAGVSSANVTLCVPRLKEVINIAKKLNTPSMSIYLKEKNNNEGYNNDEILKIRGKVEHTSLLNILSLSEIYYDPDIRNSIITEDNDMIEEYMLIRGEEIDNMRDNISPWLLRLILNKDYINIKMEAIEEIIKQKISIGNVLVIHTRETSDEKKIHIRFVCTDNDDEEKKRRLKSLEHLKVFESRLLSEVSLISIVHNLQLKIILENNLIVLH